MDLHIRDAASNADVEAARRLFGEYAESLDVDLSFQDFDRELRELPGEYVPPAGRLLLAVDAADVVGCVAIRPFEPAVAELKRLYVRPAYRGTGLGRRLTKAAIGAARDAGYERIRLDTLPSMDAARALYKSLGFVEVEAYRFNPVHGTTYFELDLRP